MNNFYASFELFIDYTRRGKWRFKVRMAESPVRAVPNSGFVGCNSTSIGNDGCDSKKVSSNPVGKSDGH